MSKGINLLLIFYNFLVKKTSQHLIVNYTPIILLSDIKWDNSEPLIIYSSQLQKFSQYVKRKKSLDILSPI